MARARITSAAASQAAGPELIQRAKKFGYSAEQVDTLRAYVRDKAPLTINFDSGDARAVSKELVFKNQYLALRSHALLAVDPGGPRDGWERRLFGDQAYPGPGIIANDRPRYGTLNAAKARHGAPQYGDSMLVLDDSLRDSVTITHADSCAPGIDSNSAGTLAHGMDHVLLAHQENRFHTLMAMSQGSRAERPIELRSGFEQLEMQVHLPLVLRPGIVKKVVAQRHAVQYADQLQRLAARIGARFTWHGGTQGITHDNRALEKIDSERWEVQTWTQHWCENYYSYAKFDPQAKLTHGFVKASSEERTQTLAQLGAAGQHVVGFHSTGYTDYFLAKRQSDAPAAPLHYVMHASCAPLALAQSHERAGYSLRAIAQAPGDQSYVLLGKPQENAAPVVHGMIEVQANSQRRCLRYEDFFDRAFSHGKQHGTVVALRPLAEELEAIEAYYINPSRAAR